MVLKAYALAISDKVWYTAIWNIAGMSNWISKDDYEEVNFYLVFIQGFDRKLMKMACEKDCPHEFKYDLITLIYNSYVCADPKAKNYILGIEGLSQLLL